MRNPIRADYLTIPMLLILGLAIPSPAQTSAGDLWTEDTAGAESLELNREIIDQLMTQLESESPALATQLRQWRKDDPFRFVLEIRRIALARNPKLARTAPRQPKSVLEDSAPAADTVRPGQWRETQEKRIEEFMEWFKTAYPDKAEPLQKIRSSDIEGFLTRISSIRRRFEPLMRAEKRDPALAKVMKKDIELQDLCGDLLSQIASIRDNDKDRRVLIEQLTRVVANQFDIIVQKRRMQYATIESKIQQMQKEVDEQNKQLDQLVQKKDQLTRDRVKELLNPPAKSDK